jgi:hypothetical protein
MALDQVYTEVARTLIESRKDLRVLSAVQKGQKEPKMLPFWVADWEEPWQVRSLVQQSLQPDPSAMGAERFSATAGRSLDLQSTDNPNHLKLKGCTIARIQVIADFNSDILCL